ncbi:MAG: OmpA family protein [Saprospiraceae bacterium]|nr:OmpA family protein [Saprospiraceae bacterium]
MKKTILLLGFCFLLGLPQIFAQGDKYFKEKQYKVAIAAYTEEVKSDAGKYYNLAKSYFAVKDFTNAIIAMEKYKEKYSKADTAYANWFIDILKRNDSEVPMRQVPGLVNSEKTESVPRISADGKRLYFKSVDREGGKGGEDIWYSIKQADGSWGKPILFSDLCTSSHETMYAMTADGNVVILFGNYQGTFGGGDLFYSVNTASGWSLPCNLGGAINTSAWEAQATISPDGKSIVFVTDAKRGDHVGGCDLYVSNLTENGWSAPKNLGKTVNTDKYETRPSFAADGKTLYFSSYGHMGFGSQDIFMTRRLDDTWTNWSKPINLGRYINTLQDDEDISVNTAGTIGYTVKTNEVGAPGEEDIFQFVIPEIARPEQTITLYGFVKNELDSAAAVNMRFTNLKTNKLETVIPSFAGDGSYSVNLPFEKFLMEINMKGFLYYSEEIDLSDPSKFLPKETIRNIIGQQTQRKIDELIAKIDMYNSKLKQLNTSQSTDVKGSFEEYEKLLKDYEQAVSDLNMAIIERKYAWLAEEKKFVDVRKDFKVQRATEGATFQLDNIFFDLGKASLKDESLPSLDELYEILEKNKIDIELGGHTDSIGSDENNLKLSQDRVNSVRSYLLNKGISSARINAVGYGESMPVASNKTEEGRALNRRVEVKIIDNTPKGKEGTEEELVEKKEEEKKKEEVVVKETISSDADLLTILQTAAKIGGLPEGSPCGDKTTLANDPTYVYTPPKKSITSGSGLSFTQFDKSDYIFKTFSAGIENFGYKDYPKPLGYNIRFTSRARFEDKGRANEYNFQYYNKTDSAKFGLGFQYHNFIGLKKLTSLPMGILWGFDMKAFAPIDSSKEALGYIGIPLGLRGLINYKQFTIAPDVLYNFQLSTTKYEKNDLDVNSKYIRVGGTVRWRFVYGGISLNLGDHINYFGFRAGLTL